MSDKHKSHVGQIVSQLGQKLKSFVRSRVRNDADAEDILQDVWQQFLCTLEDGPIDHVGAWLYTVARNRIIDEYRRPQATSLDALATQTEIDDTYDLSDIFHGEQETTEKFWNQLHAALAELPPEQRQVFLWHELDGLSFQDIAKLTGENINTLLSRKRYAVLHLRRRLAAMREEIFT
ncbi:MAG TPA: RNA polymerase sigma factor [Tepidisphaeraceae bacterium]|nr:RNA polymerase sigma factor [Tepidisphaeraceae bacterium]